jgi:methionine biosynthesis protein MetW
LNQTPTTSFTPAPSARPKYDLNGLFDPAHAHPDDAHSILMRLVPANSRVLELGCASGYLSGYLERAKNCRVTGVELDPTAGAIAAQRCTEFVAADLDDPNALASLSGSYNVLLAPAVLEHLKAPERLLQSARRWLDDGARVIVSLPNVAHWSSRLNLLRGRFDYTDYGLMDRTHLRFFTLRTGHALLTEAGYTVTDFDIAGSFLQNALSAAARGLKRPTPRPLWPGLLGYELIYVAVPTRRG